jgi:hypothetical protein
MTRPIRLHAFGLRRGNDSGKTHQKQVKLHYCIRKIVAGKTCIAFKTERSSARLSIPFN